MPSTGTNLTNVSSSPSLQVALPASLDKLFANPTYGSLEAKSIQKARVEVYKYSGTDADMEDGGQGVKFTNVSAGTDPDADAVHT